jgi:hypothetical protein
MSNAFLFIVAAAVVGRAIMAWRAQQPARPDSAPTGATIHRSEREERACPCGCGQQFPLFKGRMDYGDDRSVLFRAAHLSHPATGPHLWLVLGSGAWFDDDERDCWVVLHVWLDDDNMVTRIEDAADSPFREGDVFDERLLTRAEVQAKEGAAEWAIDRRVEFAVRHEETAAFFLAAIRAGEE